MSKVVKFGGSSLADANQFRKVADIIRSDKERRYVVPSAPGKRFKDDIKVTDMQERIQSVCAYCRAFQRNYKRFRTYSFT